MGIVLPHNGCSKGAPHKPVHALAPPETGLMAGRTVRAFDLQGIAGAAIHACLLCGTYAPPPSRGELLGRRPPHGHLRHQGLLRSAPRHAGGYATREPPSFIRERSASPMEREQGAATGMMGSAGLSA